MANQWPIRASDQDRERVAGVLGDAYAAGCLDKDELEHRSGLAYSARTLNDLQALIADLPAWLLERPVPLPHECGHGRPPRRSVLDWPAGLLLAVAGFWLIVLAVAWMPLLAAPGIAAWLLLTMRARNCRRYQHRLSTRSGNDRK